MEEINLNDLLDIFIDNIKAIVITVAVFAVLSIVYTKVIVTPMYESSTKVILAKNEKLDNSSSDNVHELTSSDVMLNQKLVATYSEIIKSRKVIDSVISELKLDLKYDDVAKHISVSPVKDSEVINISVVTDDPKSSCDIANLIVKNFAKQVKEIYNIDNVNQVDEAIVASSPNNVSLPKNLVLFCAVGLIFSYGAFFLREYFKTTISSSDEVEEILDVPVIATVPEVLPNKGEKTIDNLVTLGDSNSVVAEFFKALRTNLEFSCGNSKKVVMFTSSATSEGKSFVLSNLAVELTKIGKKVLVVDLDLRRSRQNKIFNVSNRSGVSKLLASDKFDGVSFLDDHFSEFVKSTRINNLSIITAGGTPKNPSELLVKGNLKFLIDFVRPLYDYVLVDVPPVNVVTDTFIVSEFVDASVVVATVGSTKPNILKDAKKTLEKRGVEIMGAIVNKVPVHKSSYRYKGYDYKYAKKDDVKND